MSIGTIGVIIGVALSLVGLVLGRMAPKSEKELSNKEHGFFLIVAVGILLLAIGMLVKILFF